MRGLLVPAADILLGARCPGCDRPALLLCRQCGEAIRPDPRLAWPQPSPRLLQIPSPVPPMAAGSNDDVLRRVLLAWKEHGRWALTPLLSHLLAASVTQLSEADRPVLLVPVPTSRQGKRRRGSDLVDDLARSAARLLRRAGVDVRVQQALRFARRTADQAGLASAERADNLAGAFRLRSEHWSTTREVVVVDDILTTGATVAEAVRVLDAAGHRPSGIAVVAATARSGLIRAGSSGGLW